MQLLTEKKTKAESHEIHVQRCKDNQVCWGCELGRVLGEHLKVAIKGTHLLLNSEAP